MALSYSNTNYANDHWALKRPTTLDKNFVAEFVYRDSVHVSVKMNPSDSRGYRCLAVLVADDMKSTLNRPYTGPEHYALYSVLSVLAQAYAALGCIAQVEVAGNNSQAYDPDNDVVILGRGEPSMHHGHVIARGKVGHCYVEGVPLSGPPPGKLFNMRGDSAPRTSPGNESKEPWAPGHIEKASAALADKLRTLPLPDDLRIKDIRGKTSSL